MKLTKVNKVLFLLALMFFVPVVSAITIEDTTIDINVYNDSSLEITGCFINTSNDIEGCTLSGDIIIEILNDIYASNNQNFTFNIDDGTKINKHFEFEFIFLKNESLDSNIVDKYLICLDKKSACEMEKKSFDMAWNECERDLQVYKGANTTICGEDLNQCNFQVKEKQLDIENCQEKLEDAETETEGTKNSKWIYFFFGAAVGILGLLFYRGEIGKGNPKDKSMGEFNRNQAG